MRLIDADALEGYVRHLRKQIVEGRPQFQAEDHAFKKGAIDALWTVLFLIDGAPTVELTDEAAIEHLQATGWMQNHDREMTRLSWVSVKERLPEKGAQYLCWFGDYPTGGFCDVVYFNTKKEAFWRYEDNRPATFITHWVPLPEPPEEGDT